MIFEFTLCEAELVEAARKYLARVGARKLELTIMPDNTVRIEVSDRHAARRAKAVVMRTI
jgi:hypothetical protein